MVMHLKVSFRFMIKFFRGPSPVLRTPSPQGARGKSYLFSLWGFLYELFTNFLLAPWGEDARRAGEGLFINLLLLLKIPLRIIAVEIVLLKNWGTVTDRVEDILLIHALLTRNLLRHDAVSTVSELFNAPEL